jgi:hypothetical protein
MRYGEGSNGTHVGGTRRTGEYQCGYEQDDTNMRTDRDLVTCNFCTICSPQGCAGKKVHTPTVSCKKLHVERTQKLRYGKSLAEPSQCVEMRNGQNLAEPSQSLMLTR